MDVYVGLFTRYAVGQIEVFVRCVWFLYKSLHYVKSLGLRNFKICFNSVAALAFYSPPKIYAYVQIGNKMISSTSNEIK